MTGESLSTIGRFLPRLEKIYLDDIFSDVTFLDLIKSRNDNIIDAWKKVAKSVLDCQLPVRKIRSGRFGSDKNSNKRYSLFDTQCQPFSFDFNVSIFLLKFMFSYWVVC